MTRKTGGPKGSNYYQDPKAAGDKYEKESYLKSKAKAKFFRNFWRTKTKAYMTSTVDPQQLNLLLNHIGLIYTAGDPLTAFNTLIDAWKIGAKTGNIKEIDATELADWKIWMQYWTYIAWEVSAQALLRPFAAGMVEESGISSTTATVHIWTQSDWDAFIASLERLECPDFIYRFMKPWLYYIRLTDGYMKAELPVPPSYLLLIAHECTLAEMQAKRDAVKAKMGTAQTHCQKYGIPFSKFSVDKLKCTEIARVDVFKNQDLIALFGMMPLGYTEKTGPATVRMTQSASLTGANLTTDYSLIQYVFDDSQEMSIMHALYPLFGTVYHVDNNPYGEIFYGGVSSATVEYRTSIIHMKVLGTAWTMGLLSGGVVRHICDLFLAYWNRSADFGINWSGTEVTTSQGFDTIDWCAFRENMKLCIDTGHVLGEEALDSAFYAAKYMIYGD